MSPRAPRILLTAWFRFSFVPGVFAEVGERFEWLRRIERLYAALAWLRLISLLTFGVAVPLAMLRAPLPALALVLAWSLSPLLHLTYAPWEDTKTHKLMCVVIVPIAMLVMCQASAVLISAGDRPFLAAALAATVVTTMVVPIRTTFDWPLFMFRLGMMMKFAQSEPSARPTGLSAPDLAALHSDMNEMIQQRLQTRGWLLRRLIREEELPSELRLA